MQIPEIIIVLSFSQNCHRVLSMRTLLCILRSVTIAGLFAIAVQARADQSFNAASQTTPPLLSDAPLVSAGETNPATAPETAPANASSGENGSGAGNLSFKEVEQGNHEDNAARPAATAVPEASTLWLSLAGVLVMAFTLRRKHA